MPILRGLRASNIDDCRKHRKNHKNPQKHLCKIVKNIETQKYALNVLTNT